MAQRHYDRCERRYFDLRPKPAEILTVRGPLGHLLDDDWGVWRAFALRRLLRNPERSELWEQAQAALPLARAYEADIKAVKHKTGVAAADAANRAAIKRIGDVSGAILIARARTLSGLAVKAQVVKRWGMPDWWDPEADTYESLAAQIIDAVITAGVLRPG